MKTLMAGMVGCQCGENISEVSHVIILSCSLYSLDVRFSIIGVAVDSKRRISN